jgi:hypothetical protein
LIACSSPAVFFATAMGARRSPGLPTTSGRGIRYRKVQVRLQKVDRAMSGLLQRPREVDERFDRRQYGQLL